MRLGTPKLTGSTTRTKKPTRHALDALEEFEAAAVDLAFIGSMHPDDHDEVNRRYTAAKKRILKHLAK